ncbi:hypothetical protein, partial [Nocardia salmonicida]
MDASEALVGEMWDTYTRLVYTTELSLQWVNSPLLAANSIDTRVADIKNYLDDEQVEGMGEYLNRFKGVLDDAIGHIDDGGVPKSREWFIEGSKDREIAAAVSFITMTAATGVALPKQQDHVLSAALVSIYSSFETFASAMLEILYTHRPKAMSGNPTITLSEIIDLPDRRMILKKVARRQSESEIQQPITAWLETLAKHGGMTLPRKRWDWPDPWRRVGVLSATRNSIVHSGGRVDRKMIDRMSEIGQKSNLPPEGKSIELSMADIHEG